MLYSTVSRNATSQSIILFSIIARLFLSAKSFVYILYIIIFHVSFYNKFISPATKRTSYRVYKIKISWLLSFLLLLIPSLEVFKKEEEVTVSFVFLMLPTLIAYTYTQGTTTYKDLLNTEYQVIYL